MTLQRALVLERQARAHPPRHRPAERDRPGHGQDQAPHRRRLRLRRALLHARPDRPVRRQRADGARARGGGHDRRGRGRGHHPQGRRPRLHGAGRPRSQFARQPARHVQRRSGGHLLGDAADPRRADAVRRPPRQLHLQAARQCELCRRRDGRAVRGRHAGGDQGARSRPATPRWCSAPGRSARWSRWRRWPAAAPA